jgi:hypothetical protein
VVPLGQHSSSGVLRVGDIHKLDGVGGEVCVKKILHSGEAFNFVSQLLDFEQKDSGLTISGSTSKLGQTVICAKASKGDKNVRAVRDSGLREYINVLKNGNFIERKELRQQALLSLLLCEIDHAFKSKSMKRVGNVGASDPLADWEVFSFTSPPARCTFSHKHNNLSELDKYFHNIWDIRSMEGVVKYLTKMIVSLDRDCILKVSIKVAIPPQ